MERLRITAATVNPQREPGGAAALPQWDGAPDGQDACHRVLAKAVTKCSTEQQQELPATRLVPSFAEWCGTHIIPSSSFTTSDRC